MQTLIEELTKTVNDFRYRIYKSMDIDVTELDRLGMTVACSIKVLEEEPNLVKYQKKELHSYLNLLITIVNDSSKHLEVMKPRQFETFYDNIDFFVKFLSTYPDYYVSNTHPDTVFNMREIFSECNKILRELQDKIMECESFDFALEQLEKNKQIIWGILLKFNKLPLPGPDITRFIANRDSKVKSYIDIPIQVFKTWEKHERTLSNLSLQCLHNEMVQARIRH
ncbi:MAG: hypothetical protein WC627_12240 [Legionella sp.]|jgi:hypothetical protein